MYGLIHIKQVKQLEEKNLPVGIVSGIAGATRTNVTFRGEAGHAGSTPMHQRNDALVQASEFIRTLPEVATSVSPTADAPVGKHTGSPNDVNVSTGSAHLGV